jgi:hypothetical protein
MWDQTLFGKHLTMHVVRTVLDDARNINRELFIFGRGALFMRLFPLFLLNTMLTISLPCVS